MGWACGAEGETRNAYRILVRKHLGSCTFVRDGGGGRVPLR
jgi:hypothetical protein